MKDSILTGAYVPVLQFSILQTEQIDKDFLVLGSFGAKNSDVWGFFICEAPNSSLEAFDGKFMDRLVNPYNWQKIFNADDGLKRAVDEFEISLQISREIAEETYG